MWSTTSQSQSLCNSSRYTSSFKNLLRRPSSMPPLGRPPPSAWSSLPSPPCTLIYRSIVPWQNSNVKYHRNQLQIRRAWRKKWTKRHSKASQGPTSTRTAHFSKRSDINLILRRWRVTLKSQKTCHNQLASEWIMRIIRLRPFLTWRWPRTTSSEAISTSSQSWSRTSRECLRLLWPARASLSPKGRSCSRSRSL